MTPSITTRFSYVGYSNKKAIFAADFMSDMPDQWLFGMNVRFFYDAVFFQPGTKSNARFFDFAAGYGMQNMAGIGTGGVGKLWFNLSTAPMTYVNWAIQLYRTDNAIVLSTNPFEWTTLFYIELTVAKELEAGVDYFPALIWDKRPLPQYGGFMPGPDGVTITTVADPSGIIHTMPTNEYAQHFNWSASMGATRPAWGVPKNLISVRY